MKRRNWPEAKCDIEIEMIIGILSLARYYTVHFSLTDVNIGKMKSNMGD